MTCEGDYVQVSDGAGILSPNISILCGQNISPVILSTRRSVLVQLVQTSQTRTISFQLNWRQNGIVTFLILSLAWVDRVNMMKAFFKQK